jgi:GH15 family glucan-1,4-alpha-glucosidase
VPKVPNDPADRSLAAIRRRRPAGISRGVLAEPAPQPPLPAISRRIEDYAVIGNCETLALVGRDGSIDWLGLPRYDSAACFAALLGDESHGRWLLAPSGAITRTTRRYRGETLILETEFETEDGTVLVTDFMARRPEVSDVLRIVRGLSGAVMCRTELIVRFEYGLRTPWVTKADDERLHFVAGPDQLILDTTVPLRGEFMRTVGEFRIEAGQEIAFTLSWAPSYRPTPPPLDAAAALVQVESFWKEWAAPFTPDGPYGAPVLRSLVTLKALAHWETGGIVAAGTTSLPEKFGGTRNWDYRFCWLRDATFTLYALIGAGMMDEAKAWRQWLLRAVGGDPNDLKVLYGVAGEKSPPERELDWLPGFEGSRPVRIGNGAADQLQLDVYGEVLGAFYLARRTGLAPEAAGWALECALLEHLEKIWEEPDDGIWEVRGGRRHFTHSKVMAWVAFDRGIRSAKEFGLSAPITRWSRHRDRLRRDICALGFDAEQNSFVQSYGSQELDASLLLIPVVGFLPPTDPRIIGTVAAIEKRLLHDGFVLRYDSASVTDGLPAGEGAFLACSFWLADNYILQGRKDEARALFERLLSLSNDVGLLAEEYDPIARRQCGNFPQAFSHVALINTARNLSGRDGPVHHRSGVKAGADAT